MSRDAPEQGEIWFANFDPVEGQEQAGQRPALVVSVNELNRTGLCMVVPGTTREKRYPGRVRVPAGVGGLEHDTWFLCDQLRTPWTEDGCAATSARRTSNTSARSLRRPRSSCTCRESSPVR